MPKRTRRTPDEKIADLQAEIERIKKRAAAQKAKKDPALRHISSAVRSIDKAMATIRDAATREAVIDARTTLTACLALNDALPAVGRSAPAGNRAPRPAPGKVLDYLRAHPGSRSEDICAELRTDAAGLRPVLHQLRDDGKVKVQGKARATRYTAT